MNIAKGDLDDLKYAKILLENSSLAVRISNLLGTRNEQYKMGSLSGSMF